MIKHAFLPAIISYIALVYIVHLEAVKADMKGLASGRASRGFLPAVLVAGINVFFFTDDSWGFLFCPCRLEKINTKRNDFDCRRIDFNRARLLCPVAFGRQKTRHQPDEPDQPLTQTPDFSEVWPTGVYFICHFRAGVVFNGGTKITRTFGVLGGGVARLCRADTQTPERMDTRQ